MDRGVFVRDAPRALRPTRQARATPLAARPVPCQTPAMGTGTLKIDYAAIAANWRALHGHSAAQTGAVVKADAYGLGIGPVARTLARAGARRFFVAVAEEGSALRSVLGDGPEIFVFSGHMAGDTAAIRNNQLIPLLNSAPQALMHLEALPDHPFGIQLDTGMSRLGMTPAEWQATRDILVEFGPRLISSHLACADAPEHPQNAAQLRRFREMTRETDAPRSLAATGGILLGPDFHFDLTRPGIGLYGGLPFRAARPVVSLDLPVIQTRDLSPGETVGYGATFAATRPTRIATVSGGYADGLLRSLSGRGHLYSGDIACPIAGRVSMDLIGVDITALPAIPDHLTMIGARQSIDDLARAAGTIGYEVLTSLGPRYHRGT